MAGEQKRSKAKGRKIGRNKQTCERYRQRVGKPNGPGMPGNKSGRNKLHRRDAEQKARKV